MNLYKRLLPYVLAATPLIAPSCAKGRSEPYNKAVVTTRIDNHYFCDVNNDKLVDVGIEIVPSKYGELDLQAIQNYIRVGDTLKFRRISFNNRKVDYKVYPFNIDAVNSCSYDDIITMYNLNKLRFETGRQKQK